MNKFQEGPESAAEGLIGAVFSRLEQGADPQIARQYFGNRIRRSGQSARHPLHMRLGFKAAAFLTALALIGGWASVLPVSGWDDGQQITIELPHQFEPASYTHWVAIFANHAEELAARGGHSLVVDYFEGGDGGYFLRLNVLGVTYSDANEWLREVMADRAEINGVPYVITQPLVPYRQSIAQMLAYRLGSIDSVERSVVDAWQAAGERPGRNSFVCVMARPDQDARRVSMIEY